MCPYDGQHKCTDCPIKPEDKREITRFISLDASLNSEDQEREYAFEIADPSVNVEGDYVALDTRERIRRELASLDSQKRKKQQRAVNLQVYDLWTQGYASSDISRMLDIKKATLHGDLVRIANVVKKHM